MNSYNNPTCSIILFLRFLQVFALSKEVLEYIQPSACKDNEIFDVASLSCVECDISKSLEPSDDQLQCVCNKFSKVVDFKNGNPVCVPCGAGAMATKDGRDCITCKNVICRCSSHEIQIERNLNGALLDTVQCMSCSNNSYPSSDGSMCLPCNDVIRNGHAMCNCPIATHTRVQNYCLSIDDVVDWPNVRSTYLIKFRTESIDSYYLRTELQLAMHFCKKKNKLACEHLSNMCALTLFSNGIPCIMFLQTHMAPIRLFYDNNEMITVLNSKQISQKYSLKKYDNHNILNITMVTFSLNGDFQGIRLPRIFCHSLKNIKFGVNVSRKCTITIEELLNTKVEFLVPYLVYREKEKSFLYALPVSVKNIDESDNEVSKKQLVKKFFLVDNISGFKALPGFLHDKFKKDTNVSVIRYVKFLNIVVNVQNEDRNKIFPPMFIIEYDEVTKEQISRNLEVTIEYKITFTLKDNSLDQNIQILIGILSSIAFIFSGIKIWSYCKRHYYYTAKINILLWFLVYAMGAIGNIIILVSVVLCIYLFTFYNGQTVPHVLLPDDTYEKSLQTYVMVAFCFKVVEIMGFIYQHWSVHAFLIDWEQPRTVHTRFKYDSPHTSLRKFYSNRFPANKDTPARTPSEIISARRKKNHLPGVHTPDKNETEFSTVCSISQPSPQDADEYNNLQHLPVSIWRTYFIANEWLKLQTNRRTNIMLQSTCTLLTLKIIELQSWIVAIPELVKDKEHIEKENFILQCTVCIMIYIIIYFMQWLISGVFYDRYVKNRMQEFIDLCSIMNISLLILEFNYYGFYIHGRSVHGFADTDLCTLMNNLNEEENNLCAHRGLVPGTTEQTFIILLRRSFRTFYDEHFKQKSEHNRFLKINTSGDLNWNRISEIRGKLNYFLCQFVDHYYKDEDYIIKEQHLLEKLCDIQFSSIKEKSIFYIDNGYSFNKVTLYGNEWLLATFELTIFTFIVIMYNDYIFASVITALISQTLIIIITYNSKKNLSSKSLLDKRFLM